VVLATHGDGEPPKTLDASYVGRVNYSFDNPEKSSSNFIMGDTLDQREYFRDYLYLKKGNTYGIKLEYCNGLLGMHARDVTLLVALR